MESEKLVSADGLREWLKKIPLHDLSGCDARTVGYCPNISEENHTLENIESCKNEAVEAWNRRVNDD